MAQVQVIVLKFYQCQAGLVGVVGLRSGNDDGQRLKAGEIA